MSIDQLALRRDHLRLARGSAEPTVAVEKLVAAISRDEVETFRPLLPVGYEAGVRAYQQAVGQLTPRILTTHYTSGLAYFHEEFVPQLKSRLVELTGGAWSLEGHVAFAAGSDVDLMTHLVEALAAQESVCLYPGDWHGFLVGASQQAGIRWDASGQAALSCLCVPSVRNGHLTEEMLEFLAPAAASLLNLNLYPTLSAGERHVVAQQLEPLLAKSILSISFSRGFGLTASQLGVFLVPAGHPYLQRLGGPWNWFTYFYNALAARAFLAFDLAEQQDVDRRRAEWVKSWLLEHELPLVESGSYYVKSFQPVGPLPEYLHPLRRENIVRLCFKPPQT